MVQGIGFRPQVAETARKMHIFGTVCNYGGNVEIFAQCDENVLSDFLNQIIKQNKEQASIEKVSTSLFYDTKYHNFDIINSKEKNGGIPEIPPDLSICENCKKEILDKNSRRFLYPLISCTKCGPRFTIINKIPYDRNNTVMEKFNMCHECNKEYNKFGNIRHYAQTISCHDCGPQCFLRKKNGEIIQENIFEYAIEILKNDGVIAIKSIGGFHLVANPVSVKATEKLRKLKNRESKPFAVCFKDIETLKQYCYLNDPEKMLLNSYIKPIILLKKKKDFDGDVCKNSNLIGSMLPSNPIQLLLLEKIPALVMTSANLSSSPIIYKNNEMFDFADRSNLIDCIIFHNREILTPLDDSIFRYDGNDFFIIRRARGIVPQSIKMKTDPDIFASGGDLKSTFALAKGNSVILSQYFGDLDDISVQKIYIESLKRMKKLYNIEPEISISDLHPRYISSNLVKYKQNIKLQHHLAHSYSVMAENDLTKAVCCVLDGTGYGSDGKIWGGEFFVISGKESKRIGHFKNIKFSGADEAAKNADFCAFSCLKNFGISFPFEGNDIYNACLENNFNCFESSSAGRIFDAVSAILGLCHYNSYEGKCASLVEICASNGKCIDDEHDFVEINNEQYILKSDDLIHKIYIRKSSGESINDLAVYFHKAIAYSSCKILNEICKKYSIENIVLSGGTFQNVILRQYFRKYLSNIPNVNVYFNKKVPTNDGGIALGQAYFASLK